jgi:predicted enzyme related to lactoylglutathione lyase
MTNSDDLHATCDQPDSSSRKFNRGRAEAGSAAWAAGGKLMRNPYSFAFRLPTVVLLMVLALIGGCAQHDRPVDGRAELALSPITDNPTGKTHPGRIVWHELLTSDLRAAGNFYEKLFGWRIEYRGHSAIARNNGERVAGILELPIKDETLRAVWIPSVSVQNVDRTLGLVEANGGKVIRGPVDMDKRGRAALVRDFQGADLVLLTARGGDPAQSEAQVGDWLWNEIWTDNPSRTENYYMAVLGYDEVAPVKDDYSVFTADDQWIAGMRHLGEEMGEFVWVPVVRVANPESVAKQVESLGGEVLITPDQAPNQGSTALISDPTGAILLIQRWPLQTSDNTN